MLIVVTPLQVESIDGFHDIIYHVIQFWYLILVTKTTYIAGYYWSCLLAMNLLATKDDMKTWLLFTYRKCKILIGTEIDQLKTSDL